MAGKRTVQRGKAGKAQAPQLELGPLSGWVGFNLRLAQEVTFEAFSRRSRDIGEYPGRFATMMLIAQNPGISQTALSTANGRDKSSMTPVLEGLVRRGLVRRQKMDGDRRTYQLMLTTEGSAMLAKIVACARKHEQNLDRVIGPRDRDRFLKVLKKIAREVR